MGFSHYSVPIQKINTLPGWKRGSWGYHGDDGKIFGHTGLGTKYSEAFSTGDTIGCGVNFKDHTAYFTRNGNFLGLKFNFVSV